MKDQQETATALQLVQDIREAYVFDRPAIEAIERKILSVAQDARRIDARIELEDGRTLTGASVVKLLDHDLLEQLQMEGFSLDAVGAANTYRIRFDQRTSMLTIFSDDPVAGNDAAQSILRVLKNCRPWYWPFYRRAFEMISFIVLMVFFMVVLILIAEDFDPNVRAVISGLAAAGVLTLSSKAFFRRTEYKFGLAGKKAAARAQWRVWIGGGVVLTFVVGVLVNLVSNQIISP